ncbi:MAG: MFS transporter, partial [Acidimicrobiales bacterium]
AFLAAGPGLAFLVLLLVGAATVSTFSVTVVMGKEYLPGRIGVASGVMFGLSIGMGGVGASLLGLVADAYGVTRALEIVAVLPVAGLALTLTLPSVLGRKRGDLTRSTPAAPAA